MEAIVVRRNRVAGALAALGFAAPLALVALALPGLISWNAASGIAFNVLSYAWIPAIIWFGFYAPKRLTGTVEVTKGLLRARDERGEVVIRATRGRIDRLRDGRWRVETHQGRWRKTRIEVKSEADARQIITNLGIDRREGTTQFTVQSNVYDFTFPVALGALLIGVIGLSTSIPIARALLPVVLVALGASYFASRRISLTCGVDGIHLRGLRKKQFIPHSQIRDVRRIVPSGKVVVSPGIEIELVDGRVLKFDTRGTRFDVGVWEADPVFEAIALMRARSTADAAATALLERGSRTTTEWIEAIRAVGQGTTHYRIAALDERSLENVLGDANAPVDARAAAAVALRAKDPARLRLALDEVADAEVRGVALAEEGEVESKLAALVTER